MPYCPATVHPRNTVYYTPVSKLLFKEVGINCLVLVITRSLHMSNSHTMPHKYAVNNN